MEDNDYSNAQEAQTHIYMFAPSGDFCSVFITDESFPTRDKVRNYFSEVSEVSIRVEKTFKKDIKSLEEILANSARDKHISLINGKLKSPTNKFIMYYVYKAQEKKMQDLIRALYSKIELHLEKVTRQRRGPRYQQ